MLGIFKGVKQLKSVQNISISYGRNFEKRKVNVLPFKESC